MKPKRITSKEALLESVSKELKKFVHGAPLGDGPFYLVTSRRNVLIQSEAHKGVSSKPEGAQLVAVSQNITEEAAKEIEAAGGVVIVASGFHWTEESAKRNAR